MSAPCPHAASGCDYPEGDCPGHCLVDNGLRKRQDTPVYLTIVYRITHPGQPRALLEQAEWSAASHTHAIHERDQLQAENKLLKATQYGSGRLQELRDVRDKLYAANDDFRATCDHLTRENAEQIGEIVALKEQRDELLAVLRVARESIGNSLQSMIETETHPVTGLIEHKGALLAIESEQDLLNQIDSAIAKAGGAA